MTNKPSWLEGKPDLTIEISGGEKLPAYLLTDKASSTCERILEKLPIKNKLFHTRWSGREVYTPIKIDPTIPLENETMHTNQGDITYWQEWDKPKEDRSEAISLYYGPEIPRGPQGLLKVNVFARVPQTHWDILEEIGTRIWKNNVEEINILKR